MSKQRVEGSLSGQTQVVEPPATGTNVFVAQRFHDALGWATRESADACAAAASRQTQVAVERCVCAAQSLIAGAIAHARVRIHFARDMFGGATVEVARAGSAWRVTALDASDSARAQMRGALPELREAFVQRGLGAVEWGED